MKKILFMIHDLSVGGAEKVLVNLVNNMDSSKFDITVMSLFGGGVNEQFLKGHIKYKFCFKKTFKGNSQILKLFSPKSLYKKFIKDKYDIIVSYLEGPTARIVSGCTDDNTKLVSWIHIQQETQENVAYAFKSFDEAKKCYERFDNTICVSEYVKSDFTRLLDFKGNCEVLYNTNETAEILIKSEEKLDVDMDESATKICVVGKIAKNKGVDRILRIHRKLLGEGFNTHLYYLGVGPEEDNLKAYIKEEKIEDKVTFLGYQTNPYRYIKACDLFVCASFAEGFSTAATEALIVGTPVVTVDVSGMKEMLGENNEYGIVTENDENALYEGIKKVLVTDGMLKDYAKRAEQRGKFFSTENTVKAVENMLERL